MDSYDPFTPLPRKLISVEPQHEFALRQRLFAGLAEIFPVKFVSTSQAPEDVSGAILITSATATKYNIPTLQYAPDVASTGQLTLNSASVVFSESCDVHFAFRGRTLDDPSLRKVPLNTAPIPGVPLATIGGVPVWTVQKSDHTSHFQSAFHLPILSEKDYLFQWAFAGSFSQLLPLFHFIRNICSDLLAPKPLTANIMFDDPNLHAPTYGYIDFLETARHAARHNYHVSFATVPLDSFFVNQRAARIFRDHSSQLSFLVHGCVHTNRELAHLLPDHADAILATALNRIATLEHKAGINVCRVMAAPHGACSISTIDAMYRLGFDAACISRGSLMHYNPTHNWPISVGLAPAEIIHGFPVIPRFRISMDCLPSICLAAFFDQPIVPVGHHEDIRDGLDLLRHVSSQINSLGDVSWRRMGEIASSNFSLFRRSNSIHVRPFCRSFSVGIPSDADSISVSDPDTQRSLLKVASAPNSLPFNTPLPVHPGTEVLINIDSQFSGATLPVENNSTSEFWPFFRRVLVESRDRLRPRIDKWPGIRAAKD